MRGRKASLIGGITMAQQLFDVFFILMLLGVGVIIGWPIGVLLERNGWLEVILGIEDIDDFEDDDE
jgi:hypothetical protein